MRQRFQCAPCKLFALIRFHEFVYVGKGPYFPACQPESRLIRRHGSIGLQQQLQRIWIAGYYAQGIQAFDKGE